MSSTNKSRNDPPCPDNIRRTIVDVEEPNDLVVGNRRSAPTQKGGDGASSIQSSSMREARKLAQQWDQEDKRIKKQARKERYSSKATNPAQHVLTPPTRRKRKTATTTKVSRQQQSIPCTKAGLRGRLSWWKSKRAAEANGTIANDGNDLDQEIPVHAESIEENPRGDGGNDSLDDADAAVVENDLLVEAHLVSEPSYGIAADVEEQIPQAEIVKEKISFPERCVPKSARGAWLCFGLCFLLALVTVTSIVCGTGACSEKRPTDGPKQEPPTDSPKPEFDTPVTIDLATTSNETSTESPTTGAPNKVFMFGMPISLHTPRLLLSSSGLTGSIPTEIGLLTALTRLDLYDNQLTGNLPTVFGLLTKLETLRLWGNAFTGTIPTEIGAMTSLQGQIAIIDNALTGSIPSQLGQLILLEDILLYGNLLIGSIPSQLALMKSLNELGLNTNMFTGRIPTELGMLSNFGGEIGLFQNVLTGGIPSQLGNLTGMTKLLLWENELTGSISTCLGRLTSLIWLSLSRNKLDGPVPSQLGLLSLLEEFQLNDNMLTGSAPPAVCTFPALERFWIDCDKVACPVTCGTKCVC